MDILYIVIPAYNEEANIEAVINQWYVIVDRYCQGGKSKIVIINDGSKDNTLKKAKEMKMSRPLLEVIDKSNSGHGATILYAYQYALDAGADYIFQTDSDGQTLPEEFHKFWELRHDYDMLIGHRHKREDGILRFFVTKVLKLVIKLSFGITVTDANTPFRLMTADSLRECKKFVPDNFNLSNVILSIVYQKKKYKVHYIPITFRPRQGGINSINLKKIFKVGKKAFRDFSIINANLKKEGL